MLSGQQLQQKVLEALEGAQHLLKIGHIKGTWAQDHTGKNVEPWDESACQWCLEGAIQAVTHFVEDGDQIAEYCVATIQAANKEFTPILKTTNPTFSNSGSHLHKASVIPNLNDNSYKTTEDVHRWIAKAKKLATRAQWS